jgi:heme-degrading monooxygenase HmoA
VTIKVLMTRKLPPFVRGEEMEMLPKISSILIELRCMALRQPGYISGETVRNTKDHHEYLVISTWKSLSDWEHWFANPKRKELEGKIDAITGNDTEYKVYSYD